MKKHIILFILSLIFSCKSIKDTSLLNDSSKMSFNNNNSSIINSLSKEEKSKLDSLSSIFGQSNNMVLHEKDAKLIDHIINLQSGDTIVLSNLSVQTLTRGQTSSYEYELKKDDVIYFEFNNDGFNKIDQISILEGDQIRFAKSNLKRKEVVKGSFKVLDDNMVVINVKKNGFFKSNLKINFKKIVKNYRTIAIKDSVVGTEIVNQKIIDTVFNLEKDKFFSLKPYIDITSSNKLSITIPFDNKNILGWGFWFSLYPDDIIDYQNSYETLGEDPLKSFARFEMNGNNAPISLPITSNPYVESILDQKNYLIPSPRSEKNFNFYIKDSLSLTELKNENLKLENFSKLYDFKITFKLIKVIANTRIVEKEVEVIKNFVKIEKY